MKKANRLILLPLIAAGCEPGAGRNDAVAKVNDSYISVKDLETKINRVAYLPGKDFSTNEKKRELLDELINQELLFQAALKEGLLKRSERLRGDVAREYLREKLGTERYEPSEEEIRAYFEKKKDQLERIRASHILIKPDKPGDPASEAAAKKKAEEVLARVKKGGDFVKLAKDFSQDEENRDRGGDLFYFDRSKMVPEFSGAAFALANTGDVSDVVKTQFGYHIIKLTGEQRGLDFFRHSMKWQIAQEKQKEKADKLFADLRKKASISVRDANLAKVTVAAKAPPAPGFPGGMPPEAAPATPPHAPAPPAAPQGK